MGSKTELLRLTEQMAVTERAGTERAGKRWDHALTRLDDITEVHSQQLIDTNRQIEDLDNRGNRNNIRVRGSPKLCSQTRSDQCFPPYSIVF